MINLINDIRNKLNELEEKLKETSPKELFSSCFPPMQCIEYVDLSNGSNKDKMERIARQIQQYDINMLTTPKDSNIVRSALVAELKESGLEYWLAIRKFREDYDEQKQIKKYTNLLKYTENNYMNFGAVINRYKQAIDLYNENNYNKQFKN